MNELSLYILDLMQNSIAAGAKLVTVRVTIDRAADRLQIEILDDGCGMDEELLRRVTSPFATTRKTRRVGLGIPLFEQCARECDGHFGIESRKGEGTRLWADFRLSHVDLPPMGDLPATIRSLLTGAPDRPEFCFVYQAGGEPFVLDTRQLRGVLDGVPFTEPAVLQWIGEYVKEGIEAAASTT